MADHPPSVHPRRAARRVDSTGAVTRCLVLQTEHPLLVRAAVEKLRNSGLYPGCKLALVCRQEDYESFEDLPDVELMAFPRRGNYRFLDLWRRISEFSPDLICAILNRRPIFRKQKLLFFLLPVRRRLIFDGRMKPYHFRFANLQAILRRSRYEEDLPGKESSILYLPTEADAASLEVLGRLQDRKIVGPGRVRVFCSITKKTLYESRPEVSEVVTYESGQTLANLRTILRLARMRVGVSAAIFSGRPVFRLHKLMRFPGLSPPGSGSGPGIQRTSGLLSWYLYESRPEETEVVTYVACSIYGEPRRCGSPGGTPRSCAHRGGRCFSGGSDDSRTGRSWVPAGFECSARLGLAWYSNIGTAGI